jgi:putative FmdB family regulatory protein
LIFFLGDPLTLSGLNLDCGTENKELFMPLYEYDCDGCKKHLEVIQKFSDAALVTCPECGGSLSKRLSLTSFQLKGSGWYSTDYKKSANSSDKGSSSTEASPAKTSKD